MYLGFISEGGVGFVDCGCEVPTLVEGVVDSFSGDAFSTLGFGTCSILAGSAFSAFVLEPAPF